MPTEELALVPFDVQENTFLLPGPVKIHPRVLQAMHRPAIAHRSPEFSAVNQELFEGLRWMLDADHVAVLAGSGTTGMEAATSNLLHWGDSAVALSTGKFGARMAQLVERSVGDKAQVIECPWGQTFDLDQVEASLEEGAKALAFTWNETATGVEHDGPALAKLAKKHGALSIVDAITLAGGCRTSIKDTGIDVLVTGSQKCLGAPPGLAMVGMSEKALETCDSPSLSLDLAKHVHRAQKDNQTPFTPATHLHFAAVEALRMMQEEGWQARQDRCESQQKATIAAAQALGLELAADPSCRSRTVTAIRYPKPGMDAQIRPALKDRFQVVVAGAQDQWKGDVFRIAHMGTQSWTDLAAGFAALEVLLQEAGHDFQQGASLAALQAFAPQA